MRRTRDGVINLYDQLQKARTPHLILEHAREKTNVGVVSICFYSKLRNNHEKKDGLCKLRTNEGLTTWPLRSFWSNCVALARRSVILISANELIGKRNLVLHLHEMPRENNVSLKPASTKSTTWTCEQPRASHAMPSADLLICGMLHHLCTNHYSTQIHQFSNTARHPTLTNLSLN